jgi:hypothetical protein
MTPNAGDVSAVPEFSSPICAVNSTLRMNSGHPSPFAGRIFTPRYSAHPVTITTPSAIRQNALHSGGTLSTPIRIDTRFPPHTTETSTAIRTLLAESGSMGADAWRNFRLSRVSAGPRQGCYFSFVKTLF